MGMSRAQKEAGVVDLNERFANDEIVVLAHNEGLTMPQMNELRGGARAENVRVKVAKNSLAKIAIKGTPFEELGEMFSGPTIMASSQDPVAAAKIAHKFAKDNDKFVIVGGALGSQILDLAGIEQLAKLPSLDEIRSKLVGLLVAAPTKLAGIMQAPARELVGVTKAYGEKSE